MPEHNRYSHLLIDGPTDNVPFTSVPQQGASFRAPQRDRAEHAAVLQRKFEAAWSQSESDFVVSHASRNGVYLQFKSTPGFDLKIKSLEEMRSKKIRLCNVKKETEYVHNAQTGEQEAKETLFATVYVSNDKRQHFLSKITQYANEETPSGKPKNADLINGIEDLQRAMAQSFWQDLPTLLPADDAQWCEVWLSSDTSEVEAQFIAKLDQLQIPYKPGRIVFPERMVKLVYANQDQLEQITIHSDDIAEFRSPKNTADFWITQPNRDQTDWVNDLAGRMRVDSESLQSVCILDTGINNGHPLLQPVLNDVDKHAVVEVWGTHDHQGHGTLMAGLAAFGNLQEQMEGDAAVEINHILESVKILPPPPSVNNPELWGDITSQGVSRVEIQAPDRKRAFCMAVTSSDNRDRGRPSSWSGAVDNICSGPDDDTKRLMIVSAGNFTCSSNDLAMYPDTQTTDSIHDPAQSWNALSVGAYTQLTQLTDPTLAGYRPIAQVNQLSPFTTTSLTWDNKWPIKPEVVFEGGNAAVDGSGFVTECDDLSLVSTYYQPQYAHFEAFRHTSAATAQAGNFAAKIQTRYPDYWPETIRGLIVHSAEWPEALKRQFSVNDTKTELSNVLRACGYGVPNFERATECAANSLTLVSQAEIQPYECRGSTPKTKDMHFYNLPWPTEALLDLGDTPVEMRITLSYFIEPGPGEVGWKDRYRYPSHLLRFDLNSSGESRDEFVRRINAEARDEENGHPETPSASEHWVIGPKNRDKGSIHSDIWRGTAADLATSNLLAVSPRIGWWRERKHLGKCEKVARYSLIVSIKTPEEEMDIYTPVAMQIRPVITIPTGSR